MPVPEAARDVDVSSCFVQPFVQKLEDRLIFRWSGWRLLLQGDIAKLVKSQNLIVPRDWNKLRKNCSLKCSKLMCSLWWTKEMKHCCETLCGVSLSHWEINLSRTSYFVRNKLLGLWTAQLCLCILRNLKDCFEILMWCWVQVVCFGWRWVRCSCWQLSSDQFSVRLNDQQLWGTWYAVK